MSVTIIIGPPGSGKTTLATELHKATGAYVIHSDDYIKRGEQAFIDRIKYAVQVAKDIDLIIEGCWTVRVLRELLTGGVMPTHIIKMETPYHVCKQRYEERECGKDYPASMYGMVNTTFNKFMNWLPSEMHLKINIRPHG